MAVVIITAHGSIDRAVEAMRRGAFDFLPKPFTPAQVRAVLERVAQVRRLRNRVADLEEQVRSRGARGRAREPRPAARHDSRASPARGRDRRGRADPGRKRHGQGRAGRRIHGWSQRQAGPFVTVSCPSLSAELLESEMFGHVRGAFTGAVRDTTGKVAAATGGTLFLDEIGDLPLSLQPKLLRFLQERRYERVGDTKTRAADVRLIAATNRDLDAEVAAGRFRDDLLYRLNVVEFTLPPLRNRSDLVDLADHLLAFFSRQTGRKLEGFSPSARAALTRYSWPGNLRELRNAIERAVLFASGRSIRARRLAGSRRRGAGRPRRQASRRRFASAAM